MQSAPYSLTGAGVNVSVHDWGHVFSHADLAGRWIQADAGAGQVLSTQLHPSMTGGTIAGNGSLSPAYRGMATGASVYTYSYISDTWEENNYADITDALSRHLDIANDSWGYDNGCHDLPYGDYTTSARVFDRQVLGLDPGGTLAGDRMVVVFSAGNERDGYGEGDSTSCISQTTSPYLNYGTLNQPKPAKNILVVGAVDSSNGTMTDFSSWGPTSDGRLRPDIVAAGMHAGWFDRGTSLLWNCFGDPDGAPNQQCYRAPNNSDTEFGGYAWFSQTSASAAMASGAAALFLEDFRRVAWIDPLPSTVKAHFIHAARDRDDGTSWFNRGPDFASGYGILDVRAAIDQFRTGQYVERCLAGQGSSASVPIPLAATADSVKVTVAWDDPPASPAGAGPALINDLDLTVMDDAGQVHYPWTLDPANPSAEAVRTAPDALNNVEQVVAERSRGATATWTATVRASALNEPPQCFSLLYSTCSGDDEDGDGHPAADMCGSPGNDCNDADPATHAGAPETCEGVDNDCDDEADEGCDRICDNPEQLGAPSRQSASFPELTASRLAWNWTDRRLASAWVQTTPTGREVMLREEPLDGGPAGETVSISETEEEVINLSTIVWSGTNYGVLWTTPIAPQKVFFRTWSSAGASPTLTWVSGGYVSGATLAWSGRTYGVAWTEGQQVMFVPIGRDGVALAAPRVVQSFSFFPDLAVFTRQIVATPSGFAIPLFVCELVGGSQCRSESTDVLTIDDEGQLERSVKLAGLDRAVGSSLAWNGTGYAVAWLDRQQSPAQVVFARFDTDGAMIGSETPVTAGSSVNTATGLAWTGSEYAIAFFSDGWLHLARLDADGSVLGDLTGNGLSGEAANVVWTGDSYGLGWVYIEGGAYSVWTARIACCDDQDLDAVDECHGDCDDASAAVYPGAPQLCDGVNNDCQSVNWPELAPDEADYDHDGVMACGGDCNDADPWIHPGLAEICDLRDNNCNGQADEGFDVDEDGVVDCLDACPGVHDPDQPAPAAIVVEHDPGRLVRIELASGVSTPVASALLPQWVVVNRTGTTALVTRSPGYLTQVDLASGATTDLCSNLDDPAGVDYGDPESRAFVASRGAGKLYDVDLATCQRTTLAGGIPSLSGVRRSPDGAFVYFTDRDGGRLLRRRMDTGSVEVVTSSLDHPLGLDLSADGTKVYVAEGQRGAISVVSVPYSTVSTLVDGLSGPVDITLDAAGTSLFVSLAPPLLPRNGSVRLVDLGTGEIRPVTGGLMQPGGLDLVHRSCPSTTCVDGDGDGYGSPGVVTCPAGPRPDCDDTDPQAWSVPSEVLGLTLAADKTRLSWAPPAWPGGPAPAYDTLRSSAASDFQSSARCIEMNDASDTTASDPLAPSPGSAFFYLVRARTACGGGTLGAGSSGAERAGRTCRTPLWAKSMGGPGADELYDVERTSDGGYVVAGTYGGTDFWVARYDIDGVVQWQKRYDTSPPEANHVATSVRQTADGGYLVAGGHVSGGTHVHVMRLDPAGAVVWSKSYLTGPGAETAGAVRPTSDGGAVFAGATEDYWLGVALQLVVLKLDPLGGVEWARTYTGGGAGGGAEAIESTTDGGYVTAGYSSIKGGILVGRVVKLNATGDPSWYAAWGRTVNHKFHSIHETLEGGYVVAGRAGDNGWVIKLGPAGGYEWERKLGGTADDELRSVSQRPDGTYLAAGITASSGAGSTDAWVAALDTAGSILWQRTYGDAPADRARAMRLLPDHGLVLAGSTSSFGSGGDFWALTTDSLGEIAGCPYVHTTATAIDNLGTPAAASSPSATAQAVTPAPDTLTAADGGLGTSTECDVP